MQKPARALAPSEIAIDVTGCLLDPRDAFLMRDPVPGTRFEFVPGRHAAGRVMATGPEATNLSGRPVLVPELLPCGSCAACRRALPLHCPDLVRPGVTHDGGLAEQLVVPSRYVIPLDGALSWKGPLGDAALCGCFALPYQAVAVAGLSAGDVALAPPEDEALCQLLRAKGARAPGPDAPSVGWRIFAAAAVPAGPLPPGSTLVLYGDRGPDPLPTDAARAAEAQIRFVRGCHPDLYPELLAMMIRGEIGLEVERLPFARAAEGLTRCAAGPVLVLRD